MSRIMFAALLLLGQATGAGLFDLQVVDGKSGRPIAAAKLSATVDDTVVSLTTDGQGRAAIPLPDEGVRSALTIMAEIPGYVPTVASWRIGADGKPLPREYVFRIEPGSTIGGTIQDSDGKPIAGAEVRVYIEGAPEGDTHPAITDHVERSGTGGEWRCAIAPSRIEKVRLRVKGPNQATYRSFSYSTSGERAVESLRDMKDVIVIEKRFPVEGMILDVEGKPARHARVAAWSDEAGPKAFFEVQTDAEGRFGLRDLKSGPATLLVQAEGCAPGIRPFTVGADTKKLCVRLEQGRRISGRLVDEKEVPVSDARIVVLRWGEQENLEWEGISDSEGRFSWGGAPADEVTFGIGKAGFEDIREIGLAPTENEHLITLRHKSELTISGTVNDSETGKPIDWFTVTPGFMPKGSSEPVWLVDQAVEDGDGEYSIVLDDRHPAYVIRIEAEGYIPAVSPSFQVEGGNAAFDAGLRKGFATNPKGSGAGRGG